MPEEEHVSNAVRESRHPHIQEAIELAEKVAQKARRNNDGVPQMCDVLQACQDVMDLVEQARTFEPVADDNGVPAAKGVKRQKVVEAQGWPVLEIPKLAFELGPLQQAQRKHAPRGRGRKYSSDTLRMFYVNPNSLTDTAKRYIFAQQADVVLVAEAHLRGDEVGTVGNEFIGNRYSVTTAEAEQSSTSAQGTYGGALVAVKQHHNSAEVIGDEIKPDRIVVAKASNAAARVLRMVGGVKVIGGYARHGDVEGLFRQIALLTRSGAVPFVCLADWNVDFAKLSLHGAPAHLAAGWLKPSTDIACHQQGGSLIDLALVSDVLRDYLSAPEYKSDAAWAPHDAIAVELKRSPRAALKQIVVRRPVALCDKDHTCKDVKLPWGEAVCKAKEDLARDCLPGAMPAVEHAAEAMSGGGLSRQLGEEYFVYARASEYQALSARGIDPASHEGKTLLGRALPVRFKMVPKRPVRAPPPWRQLAAGGATAL